MREILMPIVYSINVDIGDLERILDKIRARNVQPRTEEIPDDIRMANGQTLMEKSRFVMTCRYHIRILCSCIQFKHCGFGI